MKTYQVCAYKAGHFCNAPNSLRDRLGAYHCVIVELVNQAIFSSDEVTESEVSLDRLLGIGMFPMFNRVGYGFKDRYGSRLLAPSISESARCPLSRKEHIPWLIRRPF